MESSEDDAGAARSASRRASAREKDVGLAEDVDGTRHYQHESSETRTLCGTPAMSEDNFDGDSVPSPSAHNTSTEAILDMIDEFVDGPGAPKRLPRVMTPADEVTTDHVATPTLEYNIDSETIVDRVAAPIHESSPLASGNSESVSDSGPVQAAESECTPNSEISICVSSGSSEDSPQACSSKKDENPSTEQVDRSVESVESQSVSEQLVSAPTSSIANVQTISDTSESENVERTVKCVTSSAIRDSVTVEIAESTSECSVSESKVLEAVSRSPLKRRLIRPVQSDRRPDSTVSSTADSQTVDIQPQQTSESITKDVSSSSDALTTVHGNVDPEQISNVTEISICKAETTAPPRKIKLVRPKVTPVMSSPKTDKLSPVLERNPCESTSSDDISSLPEPKAENSSCSSSPSEETKTDVDEVIRTCENNITETRSVQTSHIDQKSPKVSKETPIKQTEDNCSIHQQKVDDCSEKSLSNQEEGKPNLLDETSVVNQCSVAETLSTNVEIEKAETQSSERLFNEIAKVETESGSTDVEIPKVEPQNGSTQNEIPELETPVNERLSDAESEMTTFIEIATVETQSDRATEVEISKETQIGTTHIETPKVDRQSSEISTIVEIAKVDTENIRSTEDTIPKMETDSRSMDIEIPVVEAQNQSIHVINPKVETQSSRSTEDKIPKIETQSGSTYVDLRKVETQSELTNVEISKVETQQSSKSPEVVITKVESQSSDSNVYEIPEVETQSGSTNVEIAKVETALGCESTDLEIITMKIQSSGSTNIDIEKVKTPSSKESFGEERKVPPIKLSLTTIKPESKANMEVQSSKNCESFPNRCHIEPTKSQKVKDSFSDNLLINCHQEKDSEHVENCDSNSDFKKVPPIKLNLSTVDHSKNAESTSCIQKPVEEVYQKSEESAKHIPKLTIKLSNKHTEELKPPVPKLTIKPLRPPVEESTDVFDMTEHNVPCVTKINIKPIPKPTEKVNENTIQSRPVSHQNDLASKNEQIPSITKLNIKPILKPPEKINETHRKSSSSEISESEYSENDETTSTSDQASTSDQGPSDTVPKVTIKMGKPGTESEGKFYTESNIPKLTIKNIHGDKDDQDSKMKLVISQSEDKQVEKIPKLTIKTITKSESQPPLSPKLTIKPLKPPESHKDNEIPKLKISTELFSSSMDVKENVHVPKITIKPVIKTDTESAPKTPKKSNMACDSSEHIPVVTKLNIKPILKPTESCGESSECYEKEKVPVVSKLNIKPIVKPKNNEVDSSSIEDTPKIIKLNIKPLKNPEECSSEEKDCDVMNADMKDSSIPVVTKLNIKPIIKPVEDEAIKDSENQSSETGNSSDENADHIPVVTKLNIKPIVKPSELEESSKSEHNEQSIRVVTKLNIKPLVKPEESPSPSSPKKESSKTSGSPGIPVVTKLNIKPIVKPEESHDTAVDENLEKTSKNPPLVMVINMKNLTDKQDNEHLSNNISGMVHSPKISMSAKELKTSSLMEASADSSSKSRSSQKIDNIVNTDHNPNSPGLLEKDGAISIDNVCDYKSVPESVNESKSSKEPHGSNKEQSLLKIASNINLVPDNPAQNTCSNDEPIPIGDSKTKQKNAIQSNSINETNFFTGQFNSSSNLTESKTSPSSVRHKKSIMQNCTLLKKLLASTKDDEDKSQLLSKELNQSNCLPQMTENQFSNCNDIRANEQSGSEKLISEKSPEPNRRNSPKSDLRYTSETLKMRSIHDVHREANESVTKPLEISITEKTTNQVSGQDSPRIILKINKTDHGASSKIITEEIHKPTDSSPSNDSETMVVPINDVPSPKKQHVNSRRKHAVQELTTNLTMGKRLRSSRIVENAEISPPKRNTNKRSSVVETSTENKETEMSILESKRIKLEQLLSVNKSLTITPVISKNTQTSPEKSGLAFGQEKKAVHSHSLLNNENCPQKNGNSKLHNILSNLQAKQMHSLQLSEFSSSDKTTEIAPEVELNTSTGSSDVVVEITRIDNCHPEEMLINENAVCDMTETDDISQDPLETGNAKLVPEEVIQTPLTPSIPMTPTPRKRGRPRKQPLSEGLKLPPTPPSPVLVPVPATNERPQRSLRLSMRDRPAILSKPRGGRGRGRGGRRAASPEPEPNPETVTVVEVIEDRAQSPIDPTSSRIKLPRMTEALDKSVACTTPLSSRRRSSNSDMKLFGEAAVVLDSPIKVEDMIKSPDSRPRGGRGSRGGQRGRTPRGRGRGRGGGRGAMYMKETMGIYGRVCGPATTTVQLFEEETCMMDDNATPKPSHLLDEDSQSSVKSSTNDSSNKMKKSKFADLFDSNKVWTAADVKEYTWPTSDSSNAEPQIMMIQEQVAMFLGVKSFKRRYPELKRRAVGGEEREYVLSKGLVSEGLCDLGITAVDASEVLDIMLSDYPHKYEEYRAHQRQRQLTEVVEESIEIKPEEIKVEVKQEKTSDKPEPPKVDPVKARKEMAAAAIASASEWNARANAWRRPACVDLQTMTIHRRRTPIVPPPEYRVRPPLGFYPHALLPGQYQHYYKTYTSEQLRYFPLNTVLAAPPAPPSPVESSSESEGSWGDHSSSSDDSDVPHHAAKRKKLTKTKRSSQQEKDSKEKEKDESEGPVDTCRVCKLRLEANRKYTHERFLVCANCNAKLHPSCVELSADTIRKCREYPWQCAECKSCCGCHRRQDDDKMLFCDLCDRGFHIYCVGLDQVPSGRWHCVECAICKSCGAREPGGLTPGPLPAPGPSSAPPGPSEGPAPEWHHQTKRGPGGHKVYSHSLCTPCARAYRIGRYCPLCDRSFIGPKGTMQLVICKLCDRQLHQECVKQTVSALDVLHYTCGECRRGGITSRAAAVRAAPRTIATLFMAKRRFNKYAHRQYLQSRQRPPDPRPPPPPDADDSPD